MQGESRGGVLSEQARRNVADAFRSGPGAPHDARALLARLIAAEAPLLDDEALANCTETMLADLLGLGPLEALMADEATTDVLLDGPGEVWVERSGRLEPSGVVIDPGDLALVVERLVAPMGLRADRSHPVVDARRPDGTRVAIVMPPLAPEGPLVALRRHPQGEYPLGDYARGNTLGILNEVVERRANVVVYGPTGAGKTSLLASMCALVGQDQRVVVVEDTTELCFVGPLTVRLEARAPSAEGHGGFDMAALVRAALRLRPDRLVVGEVRGGEAAEMLWALSTGHRGSMSTVHAGAPVEALERIEVMAVVGQNGSVPLDAVRKQVRSAIDVLVGMGRDPHGRRVVTRIDACSTAGLERLDAVGLERTDAAGSP